MKKPHISKKNKLLIALIKTRKDRNNWLSGDELALAARESYQKHKDFYDKLLQENPLNKG